MAFGAEPAGAGASVQFIYVWPSRELTQQSWSWPATWHEAFQDAASRLGLACAICLLDGRRFSRRLISLQLSTGLTTFRVKRRGKSIFITVVEFAGPDSPGPVTPGPDGPRQPSAVDGLVLGLHGSGKTAYLVVFHGHMPPIPAGELSPSSKAGEAPWLEIRRASPQQLPTEQFMMLDKHLHGANSADPVAKRGAVAKARDARVRGFSPILHFRLVSGRPIYLTQSPGGSERSKSPRSHDRVENGRHGRRGTPKEKKVKQSPGSHKLVPGEGLQADPRLDIEKSPYRHLRSRYLH
jgi:hypothetical protein